MNRAGVVAAGSGLAAAAGARVLDEGGNAIDAALAALLTSTVSEPLLTGLGAGGYLLAVGFDAEPVVLDFFVAAPGLGSDRRGGEDLRGVVVDFGDTSQEFHVGASSVGAWGVPAGVVAASERWGSVPLERLCAPAAAHARRGVRLTEIQGYLLRILDPVLRSSPEAAEVFAPGGRQLREGDRWAWEELGDALELLGAEGAAPFYSGDVATAALAWLSERGGALTRADLEGYRAEPRAPVEVGFRGRRVLTNPPPNAGGTLLAAALQELDADGPSAVPPSAARLVEVMEAVQAGRTEAFTEGLQEPGFAERFLAGRLGSTTHVSVLDRAGRAVSMTTTNGEGCGLVVPGTGLHPNNVMGEEDLNPAGFGRTPAGRRMPSMMAPTVVCEAGGRVELVVGSAGSNRIRSAILQTVVGVLDHGRAAPAAVGAPRLHVEDGRVFAEPGVDVDALRAAGREVVPFSARNLFFGGVQAVQRDPRTGAVRGAGDPRRGGAVA